LKKATTIDEQIELYKNRNCELDIDEKEIKQILMDVGYFRLGFYSFPFEETYPKKEYRTHIYKKGTKFSDVVLLYDFDFDLRITLLKYLNYIEINFRTKLIYLVSNYFKDTTNTWFVSPKVMSSEYIKNFDKKMYDQIKEKSRSIKQHHEKYINDKYAPAWKTFEFATFGNLVVTYESLLDKNIKTLIANEYGIKNENVMLSYIRAVKDIRNVVAHNGVLFDYKLERPLKNSPLIIISNENKNKLYSAILVMKFLMASISESRSKNMEKDIDFVFNTLNGNPKLKSIITDSSGYL